jgi:hypothetical protein
MSSLIGIYKDLEENEKMLEAFPEVVEIKLGQNAPGYDKKNEEKGSRLYGKLFVTNQRLLILKLSGSFSEMGTWYEFDLSWIQNVGHSKESRGIFGFGKSKEDEKPGVSLTIESPLARNVESSNMFGFGKKNVTVKDSYSIELVVSDPSALEMKLQSIVAKYRS